MNFSHVVELIGWAVGLVWAAGLSIIAIELADMARDAFDKRRARK